MGSDYDFDEMADVAAKMADRAGAVILPYFRQADLEIENKRAADFDPVTEADRAAEQAMRDVLAQLRPDDGIVGEEFPNIIGTTGLDWVLDPIDGTRGFMSGTPVWGSLIALSDPTGPVLGVIDQPYIGERFWGYNGRAWLDGPHGRRELATRKRVSDLGEAVLFSTFPEVGTSIEEAAFKAVAQRVKLTRYGLDCYAHALLAMGCIDLVIEAGLSSYDVQAPIALIEAAGGIVTNWTGGPAHEGGRLLAAGNAELHQQALAILKEMV